MGKIIPYKDFLEKINYLKSNSKIEHRVFDIPLDTVFDRTINVMGNVVTVEQCDGNNVAVYFNDDFTNGLSFGAGDIMHGNYYKMRVVNQTAQVGKTIRFVTGVDILRLTSDSGVIKELRTAIMKNISDPYFEIDGNVSTSQAGEKERYTIKQTLLEILNRLAFARGTSPFNLINGNGPSYDGDASKTLRWFLDEIQQSLGTHNGSDPTADVIKLLTGIALSGAGGNLKVTNQGSVIGAASSTIATMYSTGCYDRFMRQFGRFLVDASNVTNLRARFGRTKGNPAGYYWGAWTVINTTPFEVQDLIIPLGSYNSQIHLEIENLDANPTTLANVILSAYNVKLL